MNMQTVEIDWPLMSQQTKDMENDFFFLLAYLIGIFIFLPFMH